jgi:prepilin signal peptidase PulO-like enzyme (type II secretory pathway)
LTSCVQFAPQVDSIQAWIWLAYFYPLFLLLLAATFIDFDEKTIPDEITLTGTLIALPLVYTFPQTRLPDIQLQDGAPRIEGLHFASPDALPTWQDGRWGLFLSCFVIALWMFALVPKRWTWRYGLVRGLALAWASILRPARRTASAGSASPRKMHRLTLLAAALGMVLIVLTIGAWSLGGPAWDRLFGAWMGLAFGGGLVWAVRIVAGGTLGKEAMGFGDVTLMGMVGAWLGWQPALLAFAIAPFAALFIAVAQLVFLRHTEIAFGPYLSLGTVVVVARWGPLWHDWARVSVFALGPVLLAIALVCLVLMAVLLGGWRWIKERWLVGGTE